MEHLKEIKDEKYINNLFRILARQKTVLVLVHVDGKEIYTDLLFHDKKGKNISINLSDNVIENNLKISLFNDETFIIFETKLIDENFIRKPDTIFTSLRRLLSRYRPQQENEIYIKIQDNEYTLLDINTQGLCFKSSSNCFNVNDEIKNIKIIFSNGLEIEVDGIIKYCNDTYDGEFIYGLVFNELNELQNYELFDYIFKNTYKNIKPLSQFSVEEIYNLYKLSGYLSLKDENEMLENFNNMVNNLNKIKNSNDISMNLIYEDNNKILTSGSALRIYDRTFLGQHLASLPTAKFNFNAKSNIYLSLIDYFLNHRKFEYYLTYFDANAKWHYEMYKKMGNYINNEDKFLFDTIQYYECNINLFSNNIKNNSKYKIEELDNLEDFINYCQYSLKSIIKESYGYSYEHFYLNEVKDKYRELGLFLDRKAWKIIKDSQIVAFVVAENYSDGLNLYNLLDMTRIYFVENNLNKAEILNKILKELVEYYSLNNKNKFNILFKSTDEEIKNINVPGLTYSHLLGRVLTNRQGASEYKKILLTF